MKRRLDAQFEEDSHRSKRRDVTHHFNPYPFQKYNGQFPYFREPKEIGSFSQNESRKFQNDRSQLKYYAPPKDLNRCNFDLHHGYDVFIRRDDTIKEYLNDLLRWILLHKSKFLIPGASGQTTLSTDFVSWRGLITKLLCTPYENREGWKIAVTLFKGTLYMCEFDTDSRKRQRESETEYQKLLTYGGYKFEQYVTCEDKTAGPDTASPVNNNAAFCSVVRTRLSKHSLVFGGEVDCCNQDTKDYIELKTSRDMQTPRQKDNFKKFKMIKWWAQSFLVGIKEIICGFRDDDGIVHRLESFRTVDIPKIVKGVPNSWSPNVCFNFCDAVLQHIKSLATEDNQEVVYLFEWYPRSEVRCTKYNRLDQPSEYHFLPDWYISELKFGN